MEHWTHQCGGIWPLRPIASLTGGNRHSAFDCLAMNSRKIHRTRRNFIFHGIPTIGSRSTTNVLDSSTNCQRASHPTVTSPYIHHVRRIKTWEIASVQGHEGWHSQTIICHHGGIRARACNVEHINPTTTGGKTSG